MKISERIKGDYYSQNPTRTAHTEGVFKAAVMLRDNHFPEISNEIIAQCAYLHDFTKEYTKEEHLEIIKKYGIKLPQEDLEIKKVYHSRTAALLGKYVYSLDDEVCQAVHCHTTGRANMTNLDKILYLADYIEENRIFPDCVRVREKYNKSYKKPDAIDRILLYALDLSLKNLIDEGKAIHHETVEARNFLLKRGIKIWKK